MNYVWVFLGLLFSELLVLSFLPKEHLVEIVDQERQSTVKWFGKEKSTEMIDDANVMFDKLFVTSGIHDSSVNFFVRHTDKDNGLFQEFGEASIFQDLSNGVKKIWFVIQSGMLRLEVMYVCLILSFTFLIPSFIDGINRRTIVRYSEMNVSIIMYTESLKIFFFCLAFPLALLFWPMAISPIYMVCWTLVLALAVWTASSNFQLEV